MGKHATMVVGPAGSGKSTYCYTMAEHGAAVGRSLHVVNLDPAADNFEYEAAIDVRELVELEDVMEELNLGPNGALVYCMEHLLENLDWLEGEVGGYGDDDYLVFDCPGQIELYTHLPTFRDLAQVLQRWGYQVACVNVVDSQFIADPSKFLSASLVSLCAMLSLELPHINVLSKMDLLDRTGAVGGDPHLRGRLDSFLDLQLGDLLGILEEEGESKHARLSRAIGGLLEDFNMVSFIPLDASDPESVEHVLAQVDASIQYGEDLEPKEPKDM